MFVFLKHAAYLTGTTPPSQQLLYVQVCTCMYLRVVYMCTTHLLQYLFIVVGYFLVNLH